MSVQRWTFAERGDDGFPAVPHKDGYWVSFDDHQSSLAEREQRIAELERLLRDSVGWLGPHHPYWDAKEPGTLEHLHERIVAALAATEGEKRE